MHSHRWFLSPVLAAAAAACLAPGASAEHRTAVTLYADAGFHGASETFYGDVSNLKRTRFGNDRASSVRLEAGCSVTLYADAYFRGRSTPLHHDVHNLSGTGVGNDSVSSLRLHCDGAPADVVDWSDRLGVALYRDAAFTGRREIFYDDDSNLRNNRIGGDVATSVRVAPGCRATLYSDSGYRGRSVEISSDVGNLGNTRLGNDTVSSLRVRCHDRRDDHHDEHDRRDDYHDEHDRWHDRHDDAVSGDPYDRDRGGVTLYRDVDFRGLSETFYRDASNLGRTRLGNGTVSSVRVSPGCRAVLYHRSDFRGEPTVLTRDAETLRFTAVGNDAVSSIEVDCRR